MKEVAIVMPTDGEILELGAGVVMRVLEDGGTTDHRLGLTESTLAPWTDGPPQHRHGSHDEAFYVLSGVIRFSVGPKDVDAEPGTLVMVPPGAPHTFANLTGDPARMLTAFTPSGYVDFFREARDIDPARMLELRAKYDTVHSNEYAP
ncbi:cupin domain-containing protein [Pseudonocardia sp. CA-107938]|uniref:cupin domain-containing protein n=1 Tax=Pseudonocardia sp. CA-107938 TaxID=3240021 RepID=UPI003D8C4193